MVPAFDKVVFLLPGAGADRPAAPQFGYHIIKVLYRN
jgi:peptidyl-prolyl cis-trans isomerase C